jgi:WD40 repeat protein
MRLRGHDERVAFVGWLPDGVLVTAAWDGTARLWSARPLPEDLDALVRSVEATHGLTLDQVLGPEH